MVNAQNLRQPAPLLDTQSLLRMGLSDDLMATPNNFNFGGLGFQEGQPQLPQYQQSPADPLRQSLIDVGKQRREAINKYQSSGAELYKTKEPEKKRPKRINDSQAGLGALAAMLMRLAGASHESVIGLYGSYINSVAKDNAEEADAANQKTAQEYMSKVEALKHDMATSEKIASMTGSEQDDIAAQIKRIADERLDILKGKSRDVEEDTKTFMTLRREGKLIPPDLALFDKRFAANGGKIPIDPMIETYDDLLKEAQGNERRLRGSRDEKAEAERLLNDNRIKTGTAKDIANKISQLRFDYEFKTYDSRVDRMLDFAEIADLHRQQEELELEALPEKIRLGLKTSRANINRIAQSMVRTQQLIDNYGSADAAGQRWLKGPMVAQVRTVITEMSNARKAIRGYVDNEQGRDFAAGQLVNLGEQALEFNRQLQFIPIKETRAALINELVQRVDLPDSIKQIIITAENKKVDPKNMLPRR